METPSGGAFNSSWKLLVNAALGVLTFTAAVPLAGIFTVA